MVARQVCILWARSAAVSNSTEFRRLRTFRYTPRRLRAATSVVTSTSKVVATSSKTSIVFAIGTRATSWSSSSSRSPDILKVHFSYFQKLKQEPHNSTGPEQWDKENSEKNKQSGSRFNIKIESNTTTTNQDLPTSYQHQSYFILSLTPKPNKSHPRYPVYVTFLAQLPNYFLDRIVATFRKQNKCL